MTIKIISLAADFSPSPAGRFITDGPFPGQSFRDNHLLPAIRQNDKVIIDLEGSELAGSAFLEEVFGGLVRAGLSESILKKKLELRSLRNTDSMRIWRYIHDEAARSQNIEQCAMNSNKLGVLDPCCGGRSMWFDKNNPLVIFGDLRKESHQLCDGRVLNINPDVQMDFRSLPFESGSFNMVVFDPPHLIHAGENSWLGLKYGILGQDWREDIRAGFAECFRVLKPEGVLIFKWSEVQIKTSEILKLTEKKPLFGHASGRRSNTHWIVFLNY